MRYKPKEPKFIDAQIPFCGFYDNFYSSAVDDALDTYRDEGGKFDFDNFNYKEAYIKIAKKYCELFIKMLNELYLGVKLVIKSDPEMISPKEYNFTTDRLFVKLEIAALKRLYKVVNKNRLDEIVTKMFTSCDGFVSYYSNNLEDWPKHIKDWDHNELHALMLAAAPENYIVTIYEDIDFCGIVYEILNQNGGLENENPA